MSRLRSKRTLGHRWLGLLFPILVGALGLQSLQAAPAPKCLIVGYAPDFRGDLTTVPYEQLTHVCYAFLLAKPDGSLDLEAIKLPRLQQTVSMAHAKGAKVLISLGGWDNGAALYAAMRNSITRAALASNCLAFVQKYDLDGFDLDWEGPANAEDGASWSAFVKTLHEALHPKGKLVTSAIASWFGDNIPPQAFDHLDYALIMAYDGPGEQHSSFEFMTSQVKYWQGRGLPMSKIVVGVPFYGYPADRKQFSSFREICERDPEASASDSSKGVFYNGMPMIQRKTAFVLEQKAGGIMAWELTQDALGPKSLLGAIHAMVVGGPQPKK